jgi:hypothetical protein
MSKRGTKQQAKGEWIVDDVCLRPDETLSNTFVEARIRVRVRADLVRADGADILAAMLQDASIEVAKAWSKLR